MAMSCALWDGDGDGMGSRWGWENGLDGMGKGRGWGGEGNGMEMGKGRGRRRDGIRMGKRMGWGQGQENKWGWRQEQEREWEQGMRTGRGTGTERGHCQGSGLAADPEGGEMTASLCQTQPEICLEMLFHWV